MKKVWILAAAMAMVLSLTACGGGGKSVEEIDADLQVQETLDLAPHGAEHLRGGLDLLGPGVF